MNNKDKKNKICLELIKLINENFIEDIEIQKKLNIKNAVFKKNLYYLKKAGLKIIRKNNKYKLINYKNLIEIKPHEISILAYLMSLGENFFSYDKSQLLNSTLDKVLYFSNEKTHQKIIELKEQFFKIAYFEIYGEKIQTLEKYIKQKIQTELTTISNKKILIIPQKINYTKDQAYLLFENIQENKLQKISIKKIIKISSKKDDLLLENNETIFELYAHLKNTYLLKDEERILDIQANKLVIANSQKDKISLLKRLLRYDEFCKVVAPKQDIIKMKNIIDTSCKNLGEKN